MPSLGNKLLIGVGLLGAAAVGYFIFSSKNQNPKPTTQQIIINIPRQVTTEEKVPTAKLIPKFTPPKIPMSKVPAPTPSIQEGQAHESAQVQVKPINENPLLDAGIDLGLAALSTQSAVPRALENVIAKKALRQGIGLVPLIGLPAGVALDVRNGRSIPLAIAANVLGDVAGTAAGIAGAPFGGIGGAIAGAGAQIGVQEGIYYFANQAGFT